MKKIALHWKIIGGMILGVILGLVIAKVDYQNTTGTFDVTASKKAFSDTLVAIFEHNVTGKREKVTYIITNESDGAGFENVIPVKGQTEFSLLQNTDEYTYIKSTKYPKQKITERQPSFAKNWVKPFGTIFIRMLKMLAVPLILTSLIGAIVGLGDPKRLGRMGLKAFTTYVLTTIVAVSLGLVLVNLFQPGKAFSDERRAEFQEQYSESTTSKVASAASEVDKGPLQPLIDLVPDNLFKGMSNNGSMLQVIFFAIFFGVALMLIPSEKSQPVIRFVDGAFDAIIKMIMIVMQYAPIGVMALLAGLVAEFAGDAGELLSVLGKYSLVVIAGLFLLTTVFYPGVLFAFTKVGPVDFFKGIGKAQMLAFSTSSSAATLPVTMDCAENNLGVSKEVSSFVLPMGATVNMDGTSLFQAVSAVFIAQAFNIDLTLTDQLLIVLTCTLASIGAAAVPGAGTLMLVIVLEQAGIPVEGVALIFAVDRILDMCRTVVNVTGDSAIAMIIAKSEGLLKKVKPQ